VCACVCKCLLVQASLFSSFCLWVYYDYFCVKKRICACLSVCMYLCVCAYRSTGCVTLINRYVYTAARLFSCKCIATTPSLEAKNSTYFLVYPPTNQSENSKWNHHYSLSTCRRIEYREEPQIGGEETQLSTS